MDFSNLCSKYVDFFIKILLWFFHIWNISVMILMVILLSILILLFSFYFLLFYVILFTLCRYLSINKKRKSFFYNYGYEYILVFVWPIIYIIIGAYHLSYELSLIDKLLANFIIFFYLTVLFIFLCLCFHFIFQNEIVLFFHYLIKIFIIISFCFAKCFYFNMANNLFTIYLAIELLSLCLYIFIVLNKNSSIRVESALKLFIYSVFSTGLFLLGYLLFIWFMEP